MKFKSSLYYLGLSFLPISLMSLANIFYSLYFNYLENLYSYVFVLFTSLFSGVILLYVGKKDRESIDIYGQIFLIILIYFIVSFFILAPYYYSNYNISFVDAYFESVSGLTGTGFTIFEQLNLLDPPLILWRSSSQWFGGFYFLIFLILIFSNKQFNLKMINYTFNLESKLNLSSNLLSVANRLFLIYLSLTLIIFIFFFISGLRIFDSLNLAMTVISSGGFIPTNFLNDIITNNLQSIALCFGFLISILNFYILYNLFVNRSNLKNNKEDLYLIVLIFFFSAIFYFTNDLKLSSTFVNILTSIGTSGISTGEVSDNFGLYFLILTLIGGSVLSTTSGLKLLRIYILFKGFLIEIHKLVKPNFILNTKIMFSENKINSDNIKMSFLIFILFFLSLFILSSILMVDYLDFENSFKLSILTLTNTTTSSIYGLNQIQFSELFTFSKISLTIFMVIAKIELLAILILARKILFEN
tara:strand:+ start:11677 stop:13092 length:1416 start_codon:yes stop_codon:yes gene_type:complete